MASVLNFSTKPATRSLQETAVNYSQIGDAELLSYLSSLIEENSFPASLAMFVVKLCSHQRRRNLFSQFVRMLRKHKYTRPSVYLKECTWVWSTGWRERGFAMVLEGTIKWRSLNYLALLKAFTLRSQMKPLKTFHQGICVLNLCQRQTVLFLRVKHM